MFSVSSAFAGGTLVVSGTGDSQSFLRSIAVLFEEQYPGTSIKVPESIGSGGGIRAISANKIDLARTARALKKKERTKLIEFGIAKSPVVFVTNQSVVGVNNINTQQLLDIYKGQITNWQLLNGPDHKLYTINRETSDSSRKILNQYISGFEDIESKSKVVDSTPKTVAILEKYDYTIGYLPLSEVKNSNLKALKFNNVEASPNNVENGKYALVNTFYLVSNINPDGLTKQFLDFIYTPAVKKIILRHGLTPLKKPLHLP